MANPVRHFGEQKPTIDGKTTFDGKFIDASDKTYYNSDYYKSHQKTVQSFPESKTPCNIDLSTVLPSETINKIKQSGKISFHSLGDTGATSLSKWGNEDTVAEVMAKEVASGNSSFLFHLGDVVYQFGEENYYYEQFYDPYRNYEAPIFAIPGNHDGMIYNTGMKSLSAFIANFCTEQPQPTPNSGGLIRSTMNQPGVYFTLDAPFVSIIGLYSNVIDGGPGVISTQGGKFNAVTNMQIDFLTSELQRLKAGMKNNPRAIIVAVHHPPFAGDSKHGGSPRMSQDLDTIFNKTGLWPDAVISGHAHNYERFTRTINNKKMPYIIAGSGGYNMTPVKNAPKKFPFPIPDNKELVIANYLPAYGYLMITSDSKKQKLTITFNPVKTATTGTFKSDTVVVNWGKGM